MSAVLDASAVLALVQREPGAERVEVLLDGAVVSAVNWSEVQQKLAAYDADVAAVCAGLQALGLSVEPFTEADAASAAALYSQAQGLGLSLADRCCLATALRLSVTAVTTDRDWSHVAVVGVSVDVIR